MVLGVFNVTYKAGHVAIGRCPWFRIGVGGARWAKSRWNGFVTRSEEKLVSLK